MKGKSYLCAPESTKTFFVMEGWSEFILKLPGLPLGITEIESVITSDFFKSFDHSPITSAEYNVRVTFDKKPGLFIAVVNAKGWHGATCDRCLEDIRLPENTRYQYYFKVGVDENWDEDEDVITIDEGTVELDLRPFIYEAIVLSLPIVNTYDCSSDPAPPCDENVLDILEESQFDSEKKDPTWDVLKNIKFED